MLHGHFTVNGRKVSIPSYRVRPGEIVAWKEASKRKAPYDEASRQVGQRPVPEWLELDRAEMAGMISRVPDAGDLDTLVDTRLIVEHYSR